MDRCRTAALIIGLASLHPQAYAESEPNPWLLGDWGGKRSALAEKGIDIEAVATVDVLGVVSGGIKHGVESPANFDLAVQVDTGKAGWWNNGTLRLYLLGNTGGDTNNLLGALQVASNIEAPDTVKLYEAWYEHKFFDDKLSVLAGLHDLNSEFYVTDLSGVFLNSSFGVGQEVAQIGPSIFPTSGMTVRVKVSPTERTYVMGAVYDGVPGDPNDPYGTHVDFNDHDGVLAIGEAGITGGKGHFFKVAVGGWHQTDFDNMITGVRGQNSGMYVVGETDLWRCEDGRGLGVFGQLGFADQANNQTDLYAGGGVNWTGPLASRPADVAGVAFAYARNGDKFLNANPGGFRETETLIEVTYAITPLPWLLVQPDFQYFFNPGSDRAIEDAAVIGMRVGVTF